MGSVNPLNQLRDSSSLGGLVTTLTLGAKVTTATRSETTTAITLEATTALTACTVSAATASATARTVVGVSVVVTGTALFHVDLFASDLVGVSGNSGRIASRLHEIDKGAVLSHTIS